MSVWARVAHSGNATVIGASGLVRLATSEPKYLRIPFLVDTRASTCSWLLVYILYLCHCYILAYG